MKLVIDGREYDAAAQPFIGDLRLLKAEFGFGWGEVAKRLEGVDESSDWAALLDRDEVVEALIAWMWMVRLRAGERDITRADIDLTPLDAIEWKAEPGDELPEDGSVPTSAPADSSRGVPATSHASAGKAAASATARGTKRSTTTSKKPSTAA